MYLFLLRRQGCARSVLNVFCSGCYICVVHFGLRLRTFPSLSLKLRHNWFNHGPGIKVTSDNFFDRFIRLFHWPLSQKHQHVGDIMSFTWGGHGSDMICNQQSSSYYISIKFVSSGCGDRTAFRRKTSHSCFCYIFRFLERRRCQLFLVVCDGSSVFGVVSKREGEW